MKKPPENSGLIERILWYMEEDQDEKAEALSQVGDWLESCFSWTLTFSTEPSHFE